MNYLNKKCFELLQKLVVCCVVVGGVLENAQATDNPDIKSCEQPKGPSQGYPDDSYSFDGFDFVLRKASAFENENVRAHLNSRPKDIFIVSEEAQKIMDILFSSPYLDQVKDSLVYIQCESQDLKVLPATIGMFTKLQELDLRNNRQLRSLPSEILDLLKSDHFGVLSLQGCSQIPLEDGPGTVGREKLGKFQNKVKI